MAEQAFDFQPEEQQFDFQPEGGAPSRDYAKDEQYYQDWHREHPFATDSALPPEARRAISGVPKPPTPTMEEVPLGPPLPPSPKLAIAKAGEGAFTTGPGARAIRNIGGGLKEIATAPGPAGLPSPVAARAGVRAGTDPGLEARRAGAARALEGATTLATPVIAGAGLAAPLPAIEGLALGYGTSKLAGLGARAAGASPTTQRLAEDIGWITAPAPFLEPRVGVEFSPEGTRAAGSILGGRAGAGVASTPEGTVGRIKIGPFEREFPISRKPAAAPVLTPQTIEGELAAQPATRDEISHAQAATNYAGPQQAKAAAVARRVQEGRAATVSPVVSPAEVQPPAEPQAPAPKPRAPRPKPAPKPAPVVEAPPKAVTAVTPVTPAETPKPGPAIDFKPEEPAPVPEAKAAIPEAPAKPEVKNPFESLQWKKSNGIDQKAQEQAAKELGSAEHPKFLERAQEIKDELLKGEAKTAPEASTAAPEKGTEQPKYKFGSTQANIPKDSEAAKALQSARERIAKSDLMPTEFGGGGSGLETEPHVTVRYGIKGDDTEGIKKYFSSLAPFEASLGKTEKFEPNEHTEGAAVINAPIEAPELHKINAELEKHGEFTEPSFKEYKPHATVAYVKPDKADRYVGMDVTHGKKFTVNSIAITARNGKREEVPLKGSQQSAGVKVAPSQTYQEWGAGGRKGLGPMAESAPEAGGIGEMRTGSLTLAPHRFQYKLGTDAEGVSGLLKEQNRFNPDLAGVVSVWRDPADGKYYVVNGHHRYELAKRTGQPTISVRHVVASTAEKARSIGALQNIAEGRGTPIDAAKFFRDSKLTPEDIKAEGISLGEATAKKGSALSRLDTPLFNKVVSGEMREGRGVAIGEATDDPAEQKAILDLVDKRESRGQKISDGTLSELIRFVKESGKEQETTADLFGSQEITKSLALEKAEVSDYIKQQLAKDKKLFGFVAKEGRAEELARAGNKIEVGKSKEISQGAAQAEEVYNRLSSRGGEIATVLDEAAQQLANGQNAATVKFDAYQQVRTAIRNTLGGGQEGSPARPEGSPQSRGEPLETPTAIPEQENPVVPSAGETPGLGDEELQQWSRSQTFKIEAAGEQGGLFGAPTKIFRVSRSHSGKFETGLVYEDQLKRLSINQPEEPSLFAAPRVVPGARSALTGSETGTTAMQDLTDSIQRQVPERRPLKDRINRGAEIGEKAETAKDSVTRSYGRIKGAMAALWDAYRRPPKWSDYEDATGKWSGADQVNALDLERFTQAIKRAVPDKLRREAISNWIEAAGDDAMLKDHAYRSKAPYKKGYQAALTLSDAEKTIARNIMNRNDATLEEAQKAGILQQGVENYVRHVYSDNPKMQSRINAEMNFQSLQTKPSFTKQRTLPTYFDAEQLGFTPKDKDVGYLTAIHERSFREALAARAYVKSLMEGKASDGRPLVMTAWSSAKELEPREGQTSAAYLVRPNVGINEEYGDYRRLDHPALRGWRWAGKTEDGSPIIVQGDAVVHPEIFRKLKNNLTKSAIRSYEMEIAGHTVKPGAFVLNAAAETKHAILSFSGFHQVTLGMHAVEHRTLPALMPKLDLSQPKQRALVDHGLMVAQYDAEEQFGEGVASGGMVTKIPVAGPLYGRYLHFLFHDYLPRLKMASGLNALGRNFQRYEGKLTDDQIHAVTAAQTNAAYGGLNLRMLGRNKTMQDVLRLGLMAPDFFEARARYAGQAARPYGREQLIALLGGAVALYTIARILNHITDRDPHWDKPFAVVYRDKEYTMRPIQEDMLRLATEPGKYFMARVSPQVSSVLHLAEGRNQFGHQETVGEFLKDAAKQQAPIPAQPWTRKSDDTNAEKAVESILKMVGVNVRNYHDAAEGRLRDKEREARALEKEVKQAEESQDQQTLDELMADPKNQQILGERETWTSYLEELRKIDQEIKNVQLSSNISPEDRRSYLAALRENRKELLAQADQAVAAAH